jgi:SAM-dependent methyltransferase
MKRETSNLLRCLFEEVLPPALRDSGLFRALARAAYGPSIDKLADFRRRAVELTEAEYEGVYRDTPRIHADTDNSEACVRRIVKDVLGASVCDVGCGSGYLIGKIKHERPELTRYAGVDFVLHNQPYEGIAFTVARIEALPFPDKAFDTVVCTHVLEHILDYRRALAELRRIAAKRLILVVPREREGRYTFNPHFHFFPYKESFLRAIYPVPARYLCEDVGRDIYFVEDLAP